MAKPKEFMVEDAEIVFRNFAGREDAYNAAGDRNFSVILDEETAEAMLADGWNIKRLRPREDDESEDAVGAPYIQVKVGYKFRAPLVKIIGAVSGTRTDLTEDTVEIIDDLDIENVDFIATAYDWTVNGKSGTKAYLKSMYITFQENPLELKYAEVDLDDHG